MIEITDDLKHSLVLSVLDRLSEKQAVTFSLLRDEKEFKLRGALRLKGTTYTSTPQTFDEDASTRTVVEAAFAVMMELAAIGMREHLFLFDDKPVLSLSGEHAHLLED